MISNHLYPTVFGGPLKNVSSHIGVCGSLSSGEDNSLIVFRNHHIHYLLPILIPLVNNTVRWHGDVRSLPRVKRREIRSGGLCRFSVRRLELDGGHRGIGLGRLLTFTIDFVRNGDVGLHNFLCHPLLGLVTHRPWGGDGDVLDDVVLVDRGGWGVDHSDDAILLDCLNVGTLPVKSENSNLKHHNNITTSGSIINVRKIFVK